MNRTGVAFAGCVALGAAALARSGAEQERPPDPRAEIALPEIPAEVARSFTFGFAPLAADYTFVQAIQLHGSRPKSSLYAAGTASDRLMARLLNYSVDMDPKFDGAYRFAGTALPRHTVDGKAAGVIAAEALLQRGMRERPDDWRIPFQLGFLESFYLNHMDAAARAMSVAARTPGAPRYIGFLATRLAADAGAVDMGEQLAAAMEAQTTEEGAREEWKERRLDLRMERELREIEAAAARFKARTSAWPQTIAELVRAGDLPRVPPEPHGGHYFLTSEGEARSSAVPRLRVRGRPGTQSGLLAQ